LLLLFLLVRSFVPVGFMPASAAEGKTQIVICTGQGPATISVDANKFSHDAPFGNSSHDVCPFAPALSQALGSVDVPSLPAFMDNEDRPDFQPAAALLAAVAKSWFSQGPPLCA
jgi:hypothetical protein